MNMNKVDGYIYCADEWTDRYQRNNKRSGVKNLRCFPCCSQPHHMEKGYCGRPVTLVIKRTPYVDSLELFAWAEFKTIDEIPRVRVDSKVTASEVKSLTRSRIDIYKPWYRGEVQRSGRDAGGANNTYTLKDERLRNDTLIHFNTTKKGWNYNWAATRNSGLVKHVLICYLCTLDDAQEGVFKCIASFESPHFTIYCRKQNGLPLPSMKKMGAQGVYGDDDEEYDDDEDEDMDEQLIGIVGGGKQNKQNKNAKKPHVQHNPALSMHHQPQPQMQRQRQQQQAQYGSRPTIPFVPDLDFFNDVDAVLDSKDDDAFGVQEGFDPIKSLMSVSSMNNLFLPFPNPSIPAQNNQDSIWNAPGANGAQASLLAAAAVSSQTVPMQKRQLAPRIMSNRANVEEEDSWKKLLSPASYLPATALPQGYSWNLSAMNPVSTGMMGNFSMGNGILGGSANNNFVGNPLANGLNYSSNPGVASSLPATSTNGSGGASSKKRKDMDSSSVGSSDEDIDRQVVRLCIILDKSEVLLKSSGAASKIGVPQFALEEFLLELGNVGFEEDSSNSGGNMVPLSGSMMFNMAQIEPINSEADPKSGEQAGSSVDANATKLIEELISFLLNESQITNCLKSFASARINSRNTSSSSSSSSSNVDEEQARRADFFNVFHRQLGTFLTTKGLTFKDLDELLEIPKTDPALVAKALKKFEEHVRLYVEDEFSFEQRKKAKSGPSSVSHLLQSTVYGMGSQPLPLPNMAMRTIDLTGEWRLDDATLEALDGLRAIRGLPWFIRQLLTFMEKKIIVEHLPDRLLVRLNRKLLSTGCLEYLLDKELHDLNSTGPLPWSRPVVETYKAWIEGDSFKFIHNYESNLRSERCIRKNTSGDRLEIMVNLQERIGNGGPNDEGQWRTIVEKTGYALRGSTG